jgi:hypothetical protein
MWGDNGFTLGDVADFGNENCLPAQNLIWNTKLNINRETRHIAKRVLCVRASHKDTKNER